MVLLISTYMALALVKTAPFLTTQDVTIGSDPFFIVRITAFLGAMLLIFFFGVLKAGQIDERWFISNTSREKDTFSLWHNVP